MITRFYQKATVTIFLVLAAGGVMAQPPPDLTQGVSLTLGAINQKNGLHLLPPVRETKTRVATVEDRECRATDKANSQWWMEFRAEDAYFAKDLPTGLTLEVEYFDTGQGPITLMYRAKVRGVPVREHHRRIGQRMGTNTWKTLRVSLPDAHLPGWGPGWMIRLSGEAWPPNQWEDLYIGSVSLDRKGVWLTAVPDAQAVTNPEPCRIRARVTDEAGQPVQNAVTVKFETSNGTITAEATTEAGIADAAFTPPREAGDVEVTGTCGKDEGKLKVPVLPGSGKVVLRKRVLGFEPGDTFDTNKSVKQQCERLDLSVSEEQVYEGFASAKMDYSFVPGAFGRGSVFLGKEIPGRPVRLSVQVHSDGPACEVHFVLRDSSGQTADRYGWTLWPKGWWIVPNMLDSPKVPWHAGADKPMQYPLVLEQLALVGTPWNGDRYKPAGSVYFDYLVVEFLAAESEVIPVPIEVQAKQDGARVLVTVKNVSKQSCKTRLGYWVSDAWGDLTDRGVVAKTPFNLQAGEVVEFPLTFPRITKAGDFEVEIAAVVVETGDLVEIQSKWRKQ